MTDDRSAFTEARAVGKARSHEQRLAHRVERYCEVMHDAYERAAVGAGWETQQVSRKPWADVPEANKVTMRAAVAALLQAIDQERVHPEPTFTASEVKELTTTATAVALALGRKEAGEEIAFALRRRRDEARNVRQQGWPLLTEAMVIAQDVASRVSGGGSEGLTAAPASRSTPKESEPAESAFPDLPEGSDQ